MTSLRITLLLLTFSGYCFSQATKKDSSTPLKLKEVSLLAGTGSASQAYITNNDVSKLWPGFSSRPEANFHPDKIGASGRSPRQRNVLIGAYFHFDNYKADNNKYKVRQQHVIGLTYSREAKLFANYHHANYARIDTLSSSSGGAPLYRDDVFVDSYNLSYVNNNVGVDLQELFSSNPLKTFSVYTGLGASMNYSFKSMITESEQAYGGTNITSNANYNYDSIAVPKLSDAYFHPRRHRHNYAAKNSMTYKIYIPIGLTIRLSESHKFFSRITLVAQARVGYNFMKVPSMKGFTNFSTNFLFGIKYSFPQKNYDHLKVDKKVAFDQK